MGLAYHCVKSPPKGVASRGETRWKINIWSQNPETNGSKRSSLVGLRGFRVPQQSAHRYTTLLKQTMCDIVAVSSDLFRSVFVGVFWAKWLGQKIWMLHKHTDSPLGRRQHGYCWWENTREPGLPAGGYREIKMEAERGTGQPQKITRKFVQLFPILSMQHNSPQHLTTLFFHR